MFQIDCARIFPFVKPASVRAPYGTLIANGRIYSPEPKETIARRVAMREEKERERQKALSHIMTLPFRQASYWTGRGFKNMQTMFSDDRFIYLFIDGKKGKWKYDREPVWALEDGKVLDAFVKHV